MTPASSTFNFLPLYSLATHMDSSLFPLLYCLLLQYLAQAPLPPQMGLSGAEWDLFDAEMEEKASSERIRMWSVNRLSLDRHVH